jgi:hypothetical protein
MATNYCPKVTFRAVVFNPVEQGLNNWKWYSGEVSIVSRDHEAANV